MISKLGLVVFALVLSGCVNVQERPDSLACSESSATSATCSKSSFITLVSDENDGNSQIGFVEFNDDGLPFDQLNVDGVLKNIRGIASEREKSLLMVLFIHGWNHNAAQSDGNVIQFKTFLRSLQKEENTLAVGRPRAVVGLYVGWQGKASENKIIRLFSYREKKELGLKTGQQSVTNILKSLSDIRMSDKNSRLILVGHSFGGGVLYSAVKSDLLERLKAQNPQSVKLFGDLVVLVNPAIEAERFVDIHSALNKTFPECTPLSMVSFTSEGDTALSDEFPKGMRLFYADKLTGDPSDVLLTTAYGRYTPFSKYALRPDPEVQISEILTKEAFNKAASTWNSFRSAQSPFELGGISLSHNGNRDASNAWEPVLNVLVDKSLIQEHNEIWDPKFQYFLRGLVGMEFAKARQCK